MKAAVRGGRECLGGWAELQPLPPCIPGATAVGLTALAAWRSPQRMAPSLAELRGERGQVHPTWSLWVEGGKDGGRAESGKASRRP